MSDDFDPLRPRPLDLPTSVPLEPGADLSALDSAKIIAAPDDPTLWPVWRERLTRWRSDVSERHSLDDAIYRRPDLAWASRCYVVSQVWLWDELLYDWDRGCFTPERLVADARDRFGGFDGIVLWHAYPVIGLDDRNQWDFYRDVEGLSTLVAELHALGVRVFVDYNPWDVGTRRPTADVGGDDATQLATLVRDLDVDGVFLDTLKEGGGGLLAELAFYRAGVAVEGESTLSLPRLADHPLSWAQWFADSPVPGVVRSHVIERRHLMHHVRRWHRDHAVELQSAWLNGVGVMVWEVVFGVWVGWNDRDAHMVSRMGPAQRALHLLLIDGEWTPLVDLGEAASARGVFGSEFAAEAERLVALVNRSDADAVIPVAVLGNGDVYDVWTGRRLEVVDGLAEVLVPANGIGGLWEPPPGRDSSWLTQIEAEPHSSAFQHRVARRVPATASTGVPTVPHVVVRAGEHALTVRFRNRETGMYAGAPFVDEWKPLSPRLHDLRTLERQVVVSHPVAVAAAEVSVAEFARYLEAAGGSAHETSWDVDRPATGVDLEDARAYAAWLGARLPTEDEWQLAAALPAFRRLGPAVWNLTESEHSDGRTRFVMLKGGADHRCEGSAWYFEGGLQPPEYTAKYLVPGQHLARATTVGFRVAWDLVAGSGSS